MSRIINPPQQSNINKDKLNYIADVLENDIFKEMLENAFFQMVNTLPHDKPEMSYNQILGAKKLIYFLYNLTKTTVDIKKDNSNLIFK